MLPVEKELSLLQEVVCKEPVLGKVPKLKIVKKMFAQVDFSLTLLIVPNNKTISSFNIACFFQFHLYLF